MSEDLSSAELHYLNIDPRAYRYIRETAVKTIYDALLELITNSIDAYNNPMINPDQDKTIDIFLNANEHSVCLIDNAVGLSGELMATYLLSVGAYTAGQSSRGFFSRGAKDLCAIGDVHFSSIHDGKFSQCEINTHGQGRMTAFNMDALQAHRDLYKIPGDSNGMHVHIKFKETFAYDTTKIFTDIPAHYALRDILTNTDYIVTLTVINGETRTQQLTYTLPSMEKVVDLDYDLTSFGYTGVSAHFELFLMDEAQPDHYDDDMRFSPFGILIDSTTGIHENTALHYTLRNNPNIHRIYGRISCSYINDLMYQLDGAVGSYDEVKNPFPIIEPSRQNGLQSTHPFTKALIDTPYKRLALILTELDEQDIGSSLNAANMSSILSNIEIMGSNLVNQLPTFANFVVRKKLVRLINNDQVSQNISENQTLAYSTDSINDRMILDNDGTEATKPKFRILFSEQELPYKYVIYKDNNGLTMKICLNKLPISDYVEINEGEVIGLTTMNAKLVLSQYVSEALTRIIAENKTADLNLAEYDFKRLFRKFEIIMNNVEKSVYNIIVKGSGSLNNTF